MKEREDLPVPQPDDPLGGMTLGTGSLTPDNQDEEFVPAETREMTDPAASRSGTSAVHRRAEVRRATEGDEPGALLEYGEATAPNDRDGGYGSQHGLAADDPAYREELRDGEPQERSLPPSKRGRETLLGGDERHDEEDRL